MTSLLGRGGRRPEARAGLQQQHTERRVLAQPGGDHRARRSGAGDHNVPRAVKRVHEDSLVDPADR
jgi:hypothetical protein